MTSKARKDFDSNFEDVMHLIGMGDAMLALDEADGESSVEEINVLYRSALVLMISHWEAYIEDICSEALFHMIENIDNPNDLPKEIRKNIGKEIKKSANDIEAWKLAGNGWKKYLKDKEMSYSIERNKTFNTPKPAQIDMFVENVLGLKKITSYWGFNKKSPNDNRQRLTTLVELRGQIAHRGKLEHEVTKNWLNDEVKFIKKLVGKTGGKINSHVKEVVGTGLW